MTARLVASLALAVFVLAAIALAYLLATGRTVLIP